MMTFLNLSAIRECTESEGPGKRFAVWCQGCAKRCPGCCNPHMQEFTEKIVVEVSDLISLIEKSKKENGIEGITFLGGEPILQAEGFAEIAYWCRRHSLSVLLFSGYVYEELISMNNVHINKLLKYTDVLVDGSFEIENYDDKRSWIGSKNQKVYFLSDFYKSGIEFNGNNHRMEILVSDKHSFRIGWPF